MLRNRIFEVLEFNILLVISLTEFKNLFGLTDHIDKRFLFDFGEGYRKRILTHRVAENPWCLVINFLTRWMTSGLCERGRRLQRKASDTPWY